MERVMQNLKIVEHSTEIMWQSKIKGPFKDFGEDEKMAVIEDLLVNPITSETLLEKYKTSVQTFRFILREKGLNPAPSDPSQMPDYPQYAERKALKNFLIQGFHFMKVS